MMMSLSSTFRCVGLLVMTIVASQPDAATSFQHPIDYHPSYSMLKKGEIGTAASAYLHSSSTPSDGGGTSTGESTQSSQQQQQPPPPKYYTYLNQEDTDKIRQIGGAKADTYGEMTTYGFQQWLSSYPLHQTGNQQHFVFPSSSSTFLDLGSGKGRMVVDAITKFGFDSSIGIELSQERHEEAIQLLQDDGTAGIHEKVILICGDASDPTNVQPLIEKATVVWCSNLLFGESLQTKIAKNLSEFGNDSVQMIASLKEFPAGTMDGYYTLQPHKLWLEMSWTAGKELPGHPPLPGHPCCIYLRNVN